MNFLEKPFEQHILKAKENWEDVKEPGDYAFTSSVGCWGSECLVLICPFCGFEAPMPWTVKITQKEPLSIEEEMHCGRCHVRFRISNGVAIHGEN